MTCEITDNMEVLKRWIVDANEGRIKFGTRELTNDELALIGYALRCVAADMKAAVDEVERGGKDAAFMARLLAEERLRMLDKFDSLLSQIKTECLQSSRGTQLGEGVEIGRKDVKDWLAARVAELKGE